MSDEKIAKQRQNVTSEIFKTELTYNKSLREINTIIGSRLKDLISEGTININPAIPDIFDKLNQIKNMSDKLMSKLYEATQSSNTNLSIGHCFDDFSEIMKYYFEFIKDYHEATNILTRERNRNSQLNDFFCQ